MNTYYPALFPAIDLNKGVILDTLRSMGPQPMSVVRATCEVHGHADPHAIDAALTELLREDAIKYNSEFQYEVRS